MRGGFLHVSQGDAGVKGGGDERVAQRMRPYRLADPGPAGQPPDNTPGTAAVQPPSVSSEEDRPLAALPDCQVDRRRGARLPQPHRSSGR